MFPVWAAQARGSSAAPFSPTDVPGLRLQARKSGTRFQNTGRSSLVTAAGQNVASWTDVSSGARHIFQATGALCPLEPVGRDGAVFNGAKILTTPALGAFGGDFYVGLVLTPATLAAGYVRFFEREPSGAGVYLGTAGSGSEVVAFVNGSASPSTAMTAGAKHSIALTRVGATARLYLDGVLVQTWAVAATAIPDLPSVIGASDGGGGAQFDGTIHEPIVAILSAGATGVTEVANLLSYQATV